MPSVNPHIGNKDITVKTKSLTRTMNIHTKGIDYKINGKIANHGI